MNQIMRQLQQMIAGLSLIRKISILATLAMSVGAILYLVHISQQANYEPVFTNLNSDDIGSIISRLDKQGVSYKVDQDMRTVMVPATQVLDVRMKLAEEGLPRFGGVGFELFDKEGFGRSDFEQRINYQRALEGELTRTIRTIKEIENARVHLVLPEKSLFNDSNESARASVILKLGRGGSLSSGTVQGIINLVASSVEGLNSNEVTVVDSNGRMLSSGGGDGGIAAGSRAYDQKLQIEKSMEQRITDMLMPIVGFGKVMTRVSADIDFTRTESTDEIVDPTKIAVTQESRTTAKKTEDSGNGAAGQASPNNSDEGSEQISYQVSKTVRRQSTPMGSVKKLSVALLVDGTYKDDNGKQVYQARSDEEIKQIEDLVKNAVGFSADRGDQIKVQNIEFKSPEQEVQGDEWMQKKNTYGFLVSVLGHVLLIIAILAIVFFVVRPIIRTWPTGRQVAGSAGGAPLLEGEVIPDIGQLIRSNPTAAAEALRRWLE